MLPGFGKLSETQFQITKDALTWITVLIAGADGEIEPEETQWATKVAKIRSYHNPNELTPFYEAVGPEFSDKLKDFIGKMLSKGPITGYKVVTKIIFQQRKNRIEL